MSEVCLFINYHCHHYHHRQYHHHQNHCHQASSSSSLLPSLPSIYSLFLWPSLSAMGVTKIVNSTFALKAMLRHHHHHHHCCASSFGNWRVPDIKVLRFCCHNRLYPGTVRLKRDFPLSCLCQGILAQQQEN